jgi:integrase/recombinase XerD
MFERLLKDPHALARQRNGPLAEERRRYLAYCTEQRMAEETLRGAASYVLVIAETLRLAERPGQLITRAEIDAAADEWINRPRKRDKDRMLAFTGHAIRWLTFLGRLQLPAVHRPYADHVAQFSEYQLRERGLSPRTVEYGERTLHQFFEQIDKAGLRLKRLTVAQVDHVLAKNVHDEGYSRATVSRWASVLRSFFAFAERRGWCRSGLAAAIMAPRLYRHEGLPLGPTWDEVKRLIATADGDRPTDIRDRAVLLLLAVYGLRAGEVTGLRLRDFDWRREILTVPSGKRQRPRTYPLCRPVGDAVLRYLCEVRQRSDRREVFLTLRAPFRSLAPDGVGEVVRRRLKALGLTLPHYGSHVLRHACATHLLAQGLSLKEIGDHLGHQSPQTTRIYAKVDLATLRTVGDFKLEGLL